MRSVKASDIGRRIGFGIAKLLGLGQNVGKAAALGLHLSQDVVAGTVEDTRDADHLFADQRLAQDLDRWGSAHHSRLEQQRRAIGLSQPGQLSAVGGYQGLVGGDHRLTQGESRLDRRLGWTIRPADQFNKNVVVWRLGQRHWIIEPCHGGCIHRACSRTRTRADTGHNGMATSRGKVRALGQKAQQPPADCAQSRHANAPNFSAARLIRHDYGSLEVFSR